MVVQDDVQDEGVSAFLRRNNLIDTKLINTFVRWQIGTSVKGGIALELNRSDTMIRGIYCHASRFIGFADYSFRI